MSAVRVKSTRTAATVVSPSLETIVSRGVLTAGQENGAIVAVIEDRATGAKIHIPSGYLPGQAAVPTSNPPEFSGMVPVAVDTSADGFYAYFAGAWHSIGGGSTSGDIDGGTPQTEFAVFDDIDGGDVSGVSNVLIAPDGSAWIFDDGAFVEVDG